MGRSGRIRSSARRAGAVVLVAIAATTTGAGAAQAAWTSPHTLDPRRAQDVGDLVVHPDGGVTAVWVEGADTPQGHVDHVKTATRAPSGAWSPATAVAPPSNTPQRGLRLALAPGGEITAVWWDERTAVHAATRAPGGGWSAPVALGLTGETPIWDPDLAFDGAGNLAVAWPVERAASDYAIRVVRRPAGGGGWLAPEAVTVAERPQKVSVATRAGSTAVVWQEQAVADSALHGAFRPAGGPWHAPQPLGGTGYEPSVGIDGTGAAVAIWESSISMVLTSTYDAANEIWDSQPALGDAGDVVLDVDADGDMLAISGRWDRSPGRTRVFASERPSGGAWQYAGEVATLPEPNRPVYGYLFTLALEADGDATVLLSHDGDLWATHRAAGGDWAAPLPAGVQATHVSGERLAVNDAGDVFATLSDQTGHKGYALDYVGPRLSDLTVPASATAGVPFGVAVSALDVGSGVAATSWSFGDGSGAGGTAARHAYVNPGTYAVTVRSTDGFGNASTATRQVVVSARSGRGRRGGRGHPGRGGRGHGRSGHPGHGRSGGGHHHGHGHHRR